MCNVSVFEIHSNCLPANITNNSVIIITLYGRIEGLFIVTRAGFPKLPLRSFLSKRIDNIDRLFVYFNEVLCDFPHFLL